MPRRPILGEISIHRSAGHELTVNQQTQIVCAIKCDAGIRESAHRLDFKPSTVQTTVERDVERRTNATKPRIGRPMESCTKSS